MHVDYFTTHLSLIPLDLQLLINYWNTVSNKNFLRLKIQCLTKNKKSLCHISGGSQIFLVVPGKFPERSLSHIYGGAYLWKYTATPQNGQAHSNSSSAVADELFEYVWPFYGVEA